MDSNLLQAMFFLIVEFNAPGNKRDRQYTSDILIMIKNNDGEMKFLHTELQAVLMMLQVVSGDMRDATATWFCQKRFTDTQTKFFESICQLVEADAVDARQAVIEHWSKAAKVLPGIDQEPPKIKRELADGNKMQSCRYGDYVLMIWVSQPPNEQLCYCR